MKERYEQIGDYYRTPDYDKVNRDPADVQSAFDPEPAVQPLSKRVELAPELAFGKSALQQIKPDPKPDLF